MLLKMIEQELHDIARPAHNDRARTLDRFLGQPRLYRPHRPGKLISDLKVGFPFPLQPPHHLVFLARPAPPFPDGPAIGNRRQLLHARSRAQLLAQPPLFPGPGAIAIERLIVGQHRPAPTEQVNPEHLGHQGGPFTLAVLKDEKLRFAPRHNDLLNTKTADGFAGFQVLLNAQIKPRCVPDIKYLPAAGIGDGVDDETHPSSLPQPGR